MYCFKLIAMRWYCCMAELLPSEIDSTQSFIDYGTITHKSLGLHETLYIEVVSMHLFSNNMEVVNVVKSDNYERVF